MKCRLLVFAAYGIALASHGALADPCSGVQGDAQFLKDNIESTIAELDNTLYFQRTENAVDVDFQTRCDSREEKSAECRALGIRLESLRYARKEKEQGIRDLTQKLNYYRQEYQTTNLKLFRCRQQNANVQISPPENLSDEAMLKIKQERKEREKSFQPPTAERPPYEPDVDLRPPNALGDPSVHGPRRSREPGKAKRIVPSTPAVTPPPSVLPSPDDMTPEQREEWRQAIEEALSRPEEKTTAKRIEELPSGFPSPDDMTAEQREKLGKALEEEEKSTAKRIVELPPGFPSPDDMTPEQRDELRKALEEDEKSTAKRIVELPSGLPSPDDMTPEQREDLRKALEEGLSQSDEKTTAERIVELPSGLPSPDAMTPEQRDELRKALEEGLSQSNEKTTAERIVELPSGLPSPDDMTAEQREQLSAALQEEPPPPSSAGENALASSPPVPQVYTCITSDDGSFPCDVSSIDADGNFEITSPGKPTYSFAYVEPGAFSVFLNSTNLPGLFRRRDTGGQTCWANDVTSATICIQ